MAAYDCACKNEKCAMYDKPIVVYMNMKDYSEDKLPECTHCGEKTKRVYSAPGLKTFGDGYKS